MRRTALHCACHTAICWRCCLPAAAAPRRRAWPGHSSCCVASNGGGSGCWRRLYHHRLIDPVTARVVTPPGLLHSWRHSCHHRVADAARKRLRRHRRRYPLRLGHQVVAAACAAHPDADHRPCRGAGRHTGLHRHACPRVWGLGFHVSRRGEVSRKLRRCGNFYGPRHACRFSGRSPPAVPCRRRPVCGQRHVFAQRGEVLVVVVDVLCQLPPGGRRPLTATLLLLLKRHVGQCGHRRRRAPRLVVHCGGHG